ncbi:hypothetical protein NE237_019774 [Protea cynaroides]|uniref:Uncharacterized protein n=1 Tax=Protea cynaroides TaxID=273540 RepID=A0A9Q0H605_9MAGN|nr:hypothetical protein NE237_019774 [Protea cynaroides]
MRSLPILCQRVIFSTDVKGNASSRRLLENAHIFQTSQPSSLEACICPSLSSMEVSAHHAEVTATAPGGTATQVLSLPIYPSPEASTTPHIYETRGDYLVVSTDLSIPDISSPVKISQMAHVINA